MNTQELRRLRELADLVLDQQLQALRAAFDAKAQSEAALEALARPMPQSDGLLGASAEIAALAYGRWADARRAEINQVLAWQTSQWIMARDAAKIAFGKADALRRLDETSGK